MSLEKIVKKLNNKDKALRVVAIAELLSIWDEKRDDQIFNILFHRFLIEEDKALKDFIAKGLTKFYPFRVAANIQRLYETEQSDKRKMGLIDLLTKIKSPGIEDYFINLITIEQDIKLVHYINDNLEKNRKSLITTQKTEAETQKKIKDSAKREENMSLFDKIKRLNHEEKEIRTIVLIELLSLWEEKKEYEIFDILFKRFLIEEDEEIINTIANGLSEINPLKAAVSIQELYEKEQNNLRKIALIDLLIKIKSPEIEQYLYKFISTEKNSRVANYIQSILEKFKKSLIDSQGSNSTLSYWVEIKFNEAIGDKICMICKLKFTKFNGILSCSICHSLFHTEHLLDWLAEKKHCPVCNRKVSDIGLKKYR